MSGMHRSRDANHYDPSGAAFTQDWQYRVTRELRVGRISNVRDFGRMQLGTGVTQRDVNDRI